MSTDPAATQPARAAALAVVASRVGTLATAGDPPTVELVHLHAVLTDYLGGTPARDPELVDRVRAFTNALTANAGEVSVPSRSGWVAVTASDLRALLGEPCPHTGRTVKYNGGDLVELCSECSLVLGPGRGDRDRGVPVPRACKAWANRGGFHDLCGYTLDEDGTCPNADRHKQ